VRCQAVSLATEVAGACIVLGPSLRLPELIRLLFTRGGEDQQRPGASSRFLDRLLRSSELIRHTFSRAREDQQRPADPSSSLSRLMPRSSQEGMCCNSNRDCRSTGPPVKRSRLSVGKAATGVTVTVNPDQLGLGIREPLDCDCDASTMRCSNRRLGGSHLSQNPEGRRQTRNVTFDRCQLFASVLSSQQSSPVFPANDPIWRHSNATNAICGS
jgi:hypothetical protein